MFWVTVGCFNCSEWFRASTATTASTTGPIRRTVTCRMLLMKTDGDWFGCLSHTWHLKEEQLYEQGNAIRLQHSVGRKQVQVHFGKSPVNVKSMIYRSLTNFTDGDHIPHGIRWDQATDLWPHVFSTGRWSVMIVPGFIQWEPCFFDTLWHRSASQDLMSKHTAGVASWQMYKHYRTISSV